MAETHRCVWDREANTWRRLVDSATVVWSTPTPGVASATAVVTPGAIAGFDEAAQDAVGGILSDAGDIDFDYADGTPAITATIKAGVVGPDELAATAVTPGSYTSADITVDADGRITAAANGGAVGGIATIASGNLSGNAVTITGIPETYAYLVLHVANGSMDTATRFPQVRASVNNGSSYSVTLGNYQGEYWDVAGVVWAENTEASLIGPLGTLSAAQVFDFTLTIFNYHTGPFKRAEYRFEGPSGTIRRGRIWFTGSTDNIDALQIIMNNTGNFDAGTYALYGVS